MPATASTRTKSPSCSRASGPPSSASGLTWIAEGTLPLAPDIRPSVTSATFSPRSCSTASTGVRLCSSGIPFAFGPWKRTTTTVSSVNSPARKARFTSSWSWNTRTGASITCRSGATAETFITPVPRFPFSRRVPPVAAKGSRAGRTILSFSVSRAPSPQTSAPSISFGSWV